MTSQSLRDASDITSTSLAAAVSMRSRSPDRDSLRRDLRQEALDK